MSEESSEKKEEEAPKLKELVTRLAHELNELIETVGQQEERLKTVEARVAKLWEEVM